MTWGQLELLGEVQRMDGKKPLETGWLKGLRIAQDADFLNGLGVMDAVARRLVDCGAANVVPVIAHFRADVPEVRRALGPAGWRAVHHATARVNAARVDLVRSGLDWGAVLAVPGVWRDLSDALWFRKHRRLSSVALSLAERAVRGRHGSHAAPAGLDLHLYALGLAADAERMGVTLNPKWSLARLRREHDEAAERIELRRASARDWARAFAVEVDGLLFERLTSNRAMILEGRAMRHCVGSYANDAAGGFTVVFRVTGAMRATCSFVRATRHGRETWIADDARGFENSEVPNRARLWRAAGAAMTALCKSGGVVWGAL